MRKKPKYKQGFYKPINPQKWKGDINNIIYRSGLELKYFKYCDLNPSILEVSSEEVVIPYISYLDGKPHRYFIDLWIKVKTKSNQIKEFLIEIKPDKFTREPILPKSGRKTRRYLEEVKNWAVNTSKWKYAKEYARKHNMEFMIMTEKDIKG